MRTTVTIDDDLLKQIESIAQQEGRSRGEVLNDTLRHGMRAMTQRTTGSRKQATETRDLGRCLVPSLDNVADALAVAEGDDFS